MEAPYLPLAAAAFQRRFPFGIADGFLWLYSEGLLCTRVSFVLKFPS